MRILYVGALWDGATSAVRMRELGAIGFDMQCFDTTPYEKCSFWPSRKLAYHYSYGYPVRQLNRDLLDFSSKIEYDAIWVDKGRWLYPRSLAQLRMRSRKRSAVHFTPDAQFFQHASRHLVNCLPFYDLAVTTKSFEIDMYKDAGARDVLLVLQGYGKAFYPKKIEAPSQGPFDVEVGFIGHCQPHYVNRILCAATATEKLGVWGPGWLRQTRKCPDLAGLVRGGPLWAEDYVDGLRSITIALGLLSRFIPEQTTTRTFEIPACGTFLLAERSEEHMELFEEGREAEFFETNEEMIDKIRFYIRNPQVRDAIAIKGFERCTKSKYSSQHQMEKIIARVGWISSVS